MPSTLIGTKLENNDNEMEEPKVDNVEEHQASALLKKKKMEKIMHQLPPQKKWHSFKK